MYKRPAPVHELPVGDVDPADVDAASRRCRCSASLAVLLPFSLPVINQIPFVRYLGDPDWLRVTTQAVIFAVAALGLNLLTGVAGQVSLGHAFFMGVGAYTAVFLGGEAERAGVGPRAADVGLAARAPASAPRSSGSSSRPAAVRVRGLYLAIVTSAWCSSASTCRGCSRRSPGQSEVGRDFPPLEFRWWKEEEPVIDFDDDGHWLWFDITGEREELPVRARLCSAWRSSSPRTSCGPAPAAPCRRSATATSPPRSWASPSSATS